MGHAKDRAGRLEAARHELIRMRDETRVNWHAIIPSTMHERAAAEASTRLVERLEALELAISSVEQERDALLELEGQLEGDPHLLGLAPEGA